MKKLELFIPWLVVCVATIGSIFFSKVYHKPPCTLCWYQRIIMFPLAIILGIAAFRRAYKIVLYVLPLAVIGLLISIYHLVMLNFFSGENVCIECTFKSISPNPITFPLVSMGVFLILNILLIWVAIKHKGSKKL